MYRYINTAAQREGKEICLFSPIFLLLLFSCFHSYLLFFLLLFLLFYFRNVGNVSITICQICNEAMEGLVRVCRLGLIKYSPNG